MLELTRDDERILHGGAAKALAKARIIVATPEMWDALMRQGRAGVEAVEPRSRLASNGG